MKAQLTSPRGAATTLDFPSQRREKIDWHKLASIDLRDLTSSCSIEVLQENLSHVAFCDAEVEFDQGTNSGRRNLLKMFRLAQLTVQYLFLSQDFIETQLKEAQEEVTSTNEKYHQLKLKFVQQVDEAKKMRATNRNMRETVKYVNSFALANGIFQPVPCPLCPKTFRSHDFLHSHLWRKHPGQASTMVIAQAPQIPPSAAAIPVQSAATLPSSAVETRDAHHAPLETPVTLAPSVTSLKTNDVDLFRHAPLETPVTLAPSVTSPKSNDVDSFRLNEIERKFDAMNNNFSKIICDMEEQKRMLERENERKQEEVKRAWEEKANLEKGYEAQLDKLGEQIALLQNNNNNNSRDHTTPENNSDKFLQLIKRQEDEIRSLRAEMENQSENRVEVMKSPDDVDGLSSELRALRKQVGEQKRQHKESLRKMHQSLQSDYEQAIATEKAKLREMMKDIAQEEATTAINSRRPPPSPTASSSSTTLGKKKHQNTGEASRSLPDKKDKHNNNISTIPSTPSKKYLDTSKTASPSARMSPELAYDGSLQSPSQPRNNTRLHRMDTQELDSDSETESESDTSRWTQSDLRVTQLQINSPNTKREEEYKERSPVHSFIHSPPPSDSVSDEESTEESEGSISDTEVTSDTLSLNALLKENPNLWDQMREATKDVLASKLSALGIKHSEKGIKTAVLTSCLSRLRKDRRDLEKKHTNFLELRKRLENEVRAKVDDKIDRVEDTTGKQDQVESRGNDKHQRTGVFSRMVKNVHSRVKEGSKAFSSSVSKTGESVKHGVKDIFHTNHKSSDDVQVIGRGRRVSVASGEGKSDDRDSSSEESDEDEEESDGLKSARIEVHNETSKSVSRNLFGNNMSGGAKPKIGGYFENKTYGKSSIEESDSEWDSDPEYENVKKAQPPERTDSLNVTLETADLHTSSWDMYTTNQSNPIKLRKPVGDNVSKLTRTIESQLGGRSRTSKLAGAVDIMGSSGSDHQSVIPRRSSDTSPQHTHHHQPKHNNTHNGSQHILNSPGSDHQSVIPRRSSDTSPQHTHHHHQPKHNNTPSGSQHTLNSPSNSSNTLKTSMWGSADDVNNPRLKNNKPLTSRATIHSWDSEDDLNISDIE
ncbi:hypothetical protein Pcinc_035467 [Petrolisthes cinctipes]|uniref:C2H2-type domain-containing protein n=1 Tax=Petrolisthes cinctipes TaxID=88211 RepID=A0AAE1EMY9_PETCI|nr:hypothetical protein Pcinc_035467 [Petrolisthes cinctipes]